MATGFQISERVMGAEVHHYYTVRALFVQRHAGIKQEVIVDMTEQGKYNNIKSGSVSYRITAPHNKVAFHISRAISKSAVLLMLMRRQKVKIQTHKAHKTRQKITKGKDGHAWALLRSRSLSWPDEIPSARRLG